MKRTLLFMVLMFVGLAVPARGQTLSTTGCVAPACAGSSATLDPATTNFFTISRAIPTITAIEPRRAGSIIFVLSTIGATIVNYNSASLVLQGSVDAVIPVNGLMQFVSLGGGNWQETFRSFAVPTNALLFTSASTCPTGYTEYTAARGRHIVGLPAGGTAAGTLGTAQTNLADSAYTPAGTVAAPTFTGTAAATSGTAAAGAVSEVTVPYTPAGTNSAPVFTGTAETTFRSSMAPYIQLLVCQKS